MSSRDGELFWDERPAAEGVKVATFSILDAENKVERR